MTEPRAELVPVVRQPTTFGEVVRHVGQGDIVPAFVTSCDPKTPEEKIAFFTAMNGEQDKSDAYINTAIEVENVSFFPGSVVNKEDGEVVHYNGVIVHTPDGKAIRFGSVGVFKSLALFSHIVEMPPWKPAKKFKLVQVATQEGRTMLRLDYIKPKKPTA